MSAPELSPREPLRGYRGALLDYTSDPTADPGSVRHEPDGLLVVEGSRIAARGTYAEVARRYPELDVEDCRGRWLIPGFVDAHVHYPQTGMIAAHGAQLLDWLESYAFPAERRFADAAHAARMASVFLAELLRNGTTSALVLGTVHPSSVDALASAAEALGMRLIVGKVLMDRNGPPELCDTAEEGYEQSKALIERWHGRARIAYAVTPRFAPSCSPAQLKAAAALLDEHPGTYLHTHLAENKRELEWVASLFPEHESYAAVYGDYGLVRRRSLFAHGIHLDPSELALLGSASASIAFCPTSNLFLGSGLFPLERVRAAGVRVALATDVGAGTSFSLLRTASEAYKVLQLQGVSLGVHEALYLATLGGARALDLDHEIGSLEPGKVADFVVLDPCSTPLLELRWREARDLSEALFALVMLGDDRAIAATYVAGRRVHERG